MKLTVFLLLLPSFLLAQTTVDKAKALYEARNPDEAKKLLITVDEKDKSFAAAQFYLGRIAFDQKDLDAAEEYLDEAIESDPKAAEYHYWLGNVLGTAARDANVLRQGMLASRIKDEYEKTVALKPDFVDARWGLISFYTEAPGIMGGSFEKAFEQAKFIAKQNEADGHRALGQIYNKQENFVEAEKEYLLAWKLNPLYLNPITNFYFNRKQYDKGFSLLESALKNDPENYPLIYQVGRASAVTGEKLDRGIECLNKYLTYQPKQNEPSHAGAQMRIGQIYEKKGNKPEAKKRYEIAIKQDPSLKDAKDGLARVSK